MGISLSSAKWLLAMTKKYNIKWNKTVTLGRQNLILKPETYKWKRYFNLSTIKQEDEYAENFIRSLCKGDITIDAIDYSPYEHATIILDMNKPLEEKYKASYDVVLDGGTLEHIFNYPQALKNSMDLVRQDGTLIIMTPANNQCGHGFYQFSPELFFSVLNKQNGYKLLHISAVVSGLGGVGARYYELLDNTKTGQRLRMRTSNATHLLVVARRIGDVPTELFIQQSDYICLWGGKAPRENKGIIRKIKDGLKKWDITCHAGLVLLDILSRGVDKNFCKEYNVDDLIR